MVRQPNQGPAEDLNLSFEKLMMLGGGAKSAGKVKMEGGVITDWKDIPMELLLQIVSLVDDRTVITASGVCRGWRDAICLGLTRLSLSWYCSHASICFSLICFKGHFELYKVDFLQPLLLGRKSNRFVEISFGGERNKFIGIT